MSEYDFEDDFEEQRPQPSIVREAISRNQARVTPKFQTQATNTKAVGKKAMAKSQTSIGSFNLEQEIRSLAKTKDLTEDQIANIFQFWTDYFTRRPEEMVRLYHLRDENPNEFRAVLFTLPFAGNRHKLETGYFLVFCFGAGCLALFGWIWLTGSFDGNRGWNHAKNRNALPNVVEALYDR